MFRKGTTILWAPVAPPPAASESTAEGSTPARLKKELRTLHVDIIGDAFWSAPPQASAASTLPNQLKDATLTGDDQEAPWLEPRRLDLSITAHGLLD